MSHILNVLFVVYVLTVFSAVVVVLMSELNEDEPGTDRKHNLKSIPMLVLVVLFWPVFAVYALMKADND